MDTENKNLVETEKPLVSQGFLSNPFSRRSRSRRATILAVVLMVLILVFLMAQIAGAQHDPAEHSTTQTLSQGNPATLMPEMGQAHHPVSTKNPEAQKFFDQGLALTYGFNHDEAVKSFQKAAELDPQLAMAYWGIAFALGPNINLPRQPERDKAAFEAIQKAQSLTASASEPEKAYIAALAPRYSNDPKADGRQLDVNFKSAMAELSKRYPEDLDAATLYAESLMDLNPWKFWTPDGKPAEGTLEIVATLESVLRRDPNHLGANHYYIHAVEASPNPERALPSAMRLGLLAPGAGHLVHMSGHTFIRTGDYKNAILSNEKAVAADEAFIKKSAAQGIYPVMYYSHNLYFLAVAETINGRYAPAKKAADQLAANVAPHIATMPMLEGFVPTPIMILVNFHRWDEILALPAPDPKQQATTGLWHYARGAAYAAKGQAPEADKERQALAELAQKVPADAMYGLFNTQKNVLSIADLVLQARIAEAKKDTNAAVQFLQQAVATEDKLNYGEPPDWYLSTREMLGGVLLRKGDPAGAEKVFRDDLAKHPRNGRALFGLAESLKAQNKPYDAQMVAQEYQTAWKDADKPLTVEDL